MTARNQRAAALLVGGGLAVLFTLIAAVQVAGWTIGAVEHPIHQVVPGPVSRLSVDAGAGDITVIPELRDSGQVTIDATVRGALHAPVLRAVKDGATVRLAGNCPYISFGPCRAQIVIRVPADIVVEVRSGSGDLTASGLTGPVTLETGSGDIDAVGLGGRAELHTSSGDVNVRALRGPASLRSGSGDITGEGLATRDVTADTASGDVELEFRLAPDLVDASTSSGDVDVAVPRGDTYRIESDPGSGDQELEVRTDPVAPRVIRAQTSSGDVSVGYGG